MSIHARLVLIAIGTFAIGTDGYVITGLLPDVGRDIGVTAAIAGQLITAFGLAYAIDEPVLTASWPRRPLLVGSLAVFGVVNIGPLPRSRRRWPSRHSGVGHWRPSPPGSAQPPRSACRSAS